MGTVACSPKERDSSDEEIFEALFEDKFEIDMKSCIGTGKFGAVHLCWDRKDPDMKYALKVIDLRGEARASMKQIEEEINVLQRLGDHRGITKLHDVDESPERIRLVMDLCEGGDLYDRVKAMKFFGEQEGSALVRNFVAAVAYIHGHKIIHRDLNPENILLVSRKNNSEVKISDFGLATMSEHGGIPRAKSICGSDFYLAPEIIRQEEYGQEVDIWAVGVIAYIVLCGSLPFFHDVLHKLYRQIVERDLSFKEPVWRSVSHRAQDFILQLLQVDPKARPTAGRVKTHPWVSGQARLA